MYDQVQGDNLKNKLLFMMLTMLGAPGIAAAAGYDLANSIDFAVNELSKSSFNQAAIIGQAGTNNSATLQQGGSKLWRLLRKKVVATGRRLTRQEIITLHIFDQAGSADDASIWPGACGNTAMIIQKGSGNKANIRIWYWKKRQL